MYWAGDFDDHFLRHMLSAIDGMPADIEWEECDRVFTKVGCFGYGARESLNDLILRYEIIIPGNFVVYSSLPRYIDNLPQMQKKVLPQSITISEIKRQNQYDIIENYDRKNSLTNAFLFAGGGNIDLNALQNWYSSPLLQSLLPLLACPIENAIAKLVATRGELCCFKFSFDDVPKTDEASFFSEIARYLDRQVL